MCGTEEGEIKQAEMGNIWRGGCPGAGGRGTRGRLPRGWGRPWGLGGCGHGGSSGGHLRGCRTAATRGSRGDNRSCGGDSPSAAARWGSAPGHETPPVLLKCPPNPPSLGPHKLVAHGWPWALMQVSSGDQLMASAPSSGA